MKRLLLWSFLGIVVSAGMLPRHEDASDVLIRHLLRREADLSLEIGRRDTIWLKAWNKGRKPDLGEPLMSGMENQAQNALDAEEAIQIHNKKFPDSLSASVGDVIKMICGDCRKERAIRSAQLAEEAK